MRDLDYRNPIAVTRDIHWVGFAEEGSSLHCNPYLMLDKDDVVLFDPGSIPHFHIVMRKIIDTVNPEEISVIVASHQDPDVCGNLAVVEDVIGGEQVRIAAHINTLRLIQHLGLRSKLYPVEQHDFRLELKSGRVLEFIFTPYLHSPGAIATYDAKTRTLFTSDIFGAISEKWSLFAEDGWLEAMEPFHQAYMPSNAVLSVCLERFEKMEIERICPQHGSILEGDQIATAITHLKSLPCGIDLLET